LAQSETLAGALVDGKYRLVRLIGQGGFGSVYEAEHAQLGRRCAIKLLDRSAQSPRAHQRFARESRVLARLDHENIVSLIDAGEDPVAGQYLALEFIRGSTLRSVLDANKTEPRQRVLEIVCQLARGLGHAHALGVVHRDLKPENVMLTTHADGRLLAKILDFGVARLVAPDDEQVSTTTTGAALGTAAYMAPEQARGDKDVDCRADVFALGVIVYEALSGARPFDGDSYNEILFRILTKEHVALTQLRPDLPAAFCSAIERALAKDRDERFASAEDFARALCDAHGAAVSTTLELEANPFSTASSGLELGKSALGSHGDSRLRQRKQFPSTVGRGVLLGAALGFSAAIGLEALRRPPSEPRVELEPSAAPPSPAPYDLPPCAHPAESGVAPIEAPSASASVVGVESKARPNAVVRPRRPAAIGSSSPTPSVSPGRRPSTPKDRGF
jgi:serine/threonine-protein kinase